MERRVRFRERIRWVGDFALFEVERRLGRGEERRLYGRVSGGFFCVEVLRDLQYLLDASIVYEFLRRIWRELFTWSRRLASAVVSSPGGSFTHSVRAMRTTMITAS